MFQGWNEDWRQVPEHLIYLASECGRIVSVSISTGMYSFVPYYLMDGRSYVSLCKDGKFHSMPVSHVILESFGYPRPEEYVAHHKDFDRTNDFLYNLEWLSRGDHLIIHDPLNRRKRKSQ
jgi:hypothetical protein